MQLHLINLHHSVSCFAFSFFCGPSESFVAMAVVRTLTCGNGKVVGVDRIGIYGHMLNLLELDYTQSVV